MSGPDYHKGYILPGEPKGSMIGPNYFTPARGDTTQPTKAIVLLTDVFGLATTNPRIVADHFAEHIGVDVWVPDLFDGKPPFAVEDLEPHMPDRAGVKLKWATMFLILYKIIVSTPKMFANRPSVVDPRVIEFISKIKSEKGYERIGAVGHCVGGAVAARLGSTDSVNTIVLAHPGPLTQAQVRAIKVPTSWLLAEDDMGFKDKQVKAAQAFFKGQEGRPDSIHYEFKVWNGTAHGFAMRPNLELPEVKAGYEGGLDQAVTWFKKTL